MEVSFFLAVLWSSLKLLPRNKHFSKLHKETRFIDFEPTASSLVRMCTFTIKLILRIQMQKISTKNDDYSKRSSSLYLDVDSTGLITS